ncbi:MAG: hypothetical protein ACREQ5_14695 [Candidatus Dormibacteria bacterium]
MIPTFILAATISATNCFTDASKVYNKYHATATVAQARILKHAFVQCAKIALRQTPRADESVYFASSVGYVYSDETLAQAWIRHGGPRAKSNECTALKGAVDIAKSVIVPMIGNYAPTEANQAAPIMDALTQLRDLYNKDCLNLRIHNA